MPTPCAGVPSATAGHPPGRRRAKDRCASPYPVVRVRPRSPGPGSLVWHLRPPCATRRGGSSGQQGTAPPTRCPASLPLTCSGCKTPSRTFWDGPAPPRGGTRLHRRETAALRPGRPPTPPLPDQPPRLGREYVSRRPTQLRTRHPRGGAFALPISVAGAWHPSLGAP